MGKDKTMKDLQEEIDVHKWLRRGYFPPMELLARLTEEVGNCRGSTACIRRQEEKV